MPSLFLVTSVMSRLWVDVSVSLLVTRRQFCHTRRQKAGSRVRPFSCMSGKYLPSYQIPLTSRLPGLYCMAIHSCKGGWEIFFLTISSTGLGMTYRWSTNSICHCSQICLGCPELTQNTAGLPRAFHMVMWFFELSKTWY